MSIDNVNRYIEFTLGHEEYAIPLMMVKEVISVPDTTPIPNSSSHFIGIMNLRGDIIPIIDLRLKLKIKGTPEKSEESVIIIDSGVIRMGIVVDSINKVLTFNSEDVSDLPIVETQVGAEFISGIYKKENDLVILLDVAKVLDTKDRGLVNEVKRAA